MLPKPNDTALQKAYEVYGYLLREEKISLDQIPFLLILAIAGFALTLISFIRNEKGHSIEETLDIVHKPGIIDRWIMRRKLKDYLKNEYPHLHYPIIRGFLKVGATLTKEDINNLCTL